MTATGVDRNHVQLHKPVSRGSTTETLTALARTAAGICRSALAMRAGRRRSHRSSPRGVLYLLETGGPGGAERVLLDLAHNLGPGWQATVGVMKSGWLQSNAVAAGIPCVMVHGGRSGDLGVIRNLVETVARHEIAVVHAHEFYMGVVGAVVSLATGVPLVLTLHGKQYYPDRRRRRAACRMIAARASAVVTVSQDLRQFFCRTTGTPAARVHVIYNGIDLQDRGGPGRTLDLLDAVRIPRSARIVGTVGNLYPVKGHLSLIRAMRMVVERCPATHLVILGRGAHHDALVAEADALGIRERVHLLGYREDVKDWLAVMDVFAMPSLSEGLPLSLLEAMSRRVPVVVTDVGGMPEVVQDGRTGFVVPPGDVRALADRISFLLGDPERAVRMGVAAQELVADRFRLDRMVAEYRDVYNRAIRGKDRARHPRKDLAASES